MRERLRDLLLGLFWMVGLPVLVGTAAALLTGWVPPWQGSVQVTPAGATTGTHVRPPAVDHSPAQVVRTPCASCGALPPSPTVTPFVRSH